MVVNKLIDAIKSKGMSVILVPETTALQSKKFLVDEWDVSQQGSVFVFPAANPQDPEDAFENDNYKFIHQIDSPPKFTVEDWTFIRKTGPLVLSDGIIEYDGFAMFREVILHLVTAEEAIKIVEGW